jgi:hypothetical protein
MMTLIRNPKPHSLRRVGIAAILILLPLPAHAADPCKSGLEPGQRPGPYSFVLATGKERGKSFCYICDTADRPAVIVFARAQSDALGKLVAGLDKSVIDHKAAELRSWVTFLSEPSKELEDQIVKWGRTHSVRNVDLGVFEDADGPPSYKIAADADVTVILYVKRKAVADFAFRAGELTEERIAEVLKAVPGVVEKK